MRVKAKPTTKPVHVTCATAEGYRWMIRNLAGAATQTADGFVVTNAGRWSSILAAAGGKEST